MHQTVTILASIGSLVLICAIYYINVMSSPHSWLRKEIATMVPLAFLVGIYPLALVGSIVQLSGVLNAGLSMNAVMLAGTDLLALALSLATIMVFRSLVKTTGRNAATPDNVTPLTPRPVHRGPTLRPMKKAA